MSDPSAGVIHSLRKTLPWVRFLSVAGFLSVAAILLLGILAWIAIDTQGISSQVRPAALLGYLILAVILFFPSFYLNKYARRIKRFVAQGHHVQLESALEAQRQLWTVVGGIALAVFALGAAAFLAALVFGLMVAV